MFKPLNLGMSLKAVAIALAVLTSTSAWAENAKIKVRDGWTPGGLQAAWFYALGKGMFAARGVDVEFEDGTGSPVAAQLVASGQFDMASADLSVMAAARPKGLKLISIAGLLRGTTLAVFVPKDSGIKTVKDLVGKQVLFTATSMEAPYIGALAKAGGVSRDKIDFVNVPASAKISSYTAGQGDGMITTVPFGAPIVADKRPSNLIEFSDYGLVLPSTGLFVRESDLADPKKVKAFETVIAVYFQAWKEIMGGREGEAADLMIKLRPEAKLNRDQIIAQTKMHYPFFNTANTKNQPLGWQSPADWAQTISSMEAAGVLPAGTKPDEYFTNKLIDAK